MEGPKYFREVFDQLCGDDWKSDETSLGYVTAYWEGAKMAGVSRPDAIAAAGRLIAGRAHLEQADAARLAGIVGARVHAEYGDAADDRQRAAGARGGVAVYCRESRARPE